MEQLRAQQVIFIPARRSPHKKQPPVASDTDRLEMIRLSIADCPSFEVSDCELRRPEPSYTLDTVLQFRSRFGPQPDLIWLVGADAVKDLSRWYRISDLMSAAIIAVMYRAGYPKPDFTPCKADFTPAQIQKLEQNILPVPLVDVSSTDIRARLAAGQDADDMLTPQVADYIRTRCLYR
jgi:nicotinate-nucleotide adenylyltransferase